MTRLETDRLILRPFAAADFEAYAAIHADPEVTRYLTATGSPLPRWEAWRSMAMFAGHWHLRGYGQWALEEKATGAFVGRAGLHNPDGWPGIEVGWTIGREHWGRGYATEAGRAAMGWAFDVLGLDRILSIIHPDNARSIRVAERLGLRYERDAEVMGGIKVIVYGRDRESVTPHSTA
jgi:RimJ/RimL family protein N-acetyltransferase